MDEERDVEVFERIPWESLEQSGDRRWMMYLAAGVIALGAVGVSLGRQMGTASAPATGNAVATPSSSPSTVPPPTTTSTATPTTVTQTSLHAWSEADLMAMPVGSIENGALARAEWYVVDFLTRDDPAGHRSFVEWARGTGIEWTDADSAMVTVLVRRLGADDEEVYQRLDAEGWAVRLDLDDDTWTVMGPPTPVDAPLPPVEAREPTTEWVDGAGVSWQVGEAVDD